MTEQQDKLLHTRLEETVAEYSCANCAAPLSITQQGSRAAQGVARCTSCNRWTGFKVEGNLFRVPHVQNFPTRLCPYCKVMAAFRRLWEWPLDDEPVSALDLCVACNSVVYFESKDRQGLKIIDQYPKTVDEAPVELPEAIKKAFQEALLCYAAGSANGALLMCRRAIQEVMNDKKAKKGDLPVQLEDLVDQRILAPTLKDWAEQAQIGGRIAAHGKGGVAWGDPDQVWGTMEDAGAVIDYCRGVFQFLYVEVERNRERMAAHRPPATQSEPSSNAPSPASAPARAPH